MGHESLAMTLRYAHLSATHQRDAVRRLERPAVATTDTDAEREPAPEPAPALEAVGDGRGATCVTGRVLDGKKKWRRAESNCGPRDYETLALAN
jgi:hypothetical protein